MKDLRRVVDCYATWPIEPRALPNGSRVTYTAQWIPCHGFTEKVPLQVTNQSSLAPTPSPVTGVTNQSSLAPTLSPVTGVTNQSSLAPTLDR